MPFGRGQIARTRYKVAVHTGATWRIRLNDRCAVTMRPCQITFITFVVAAAFVTVVVVFVVLGQVKYYTSCDALNGTDNRL